MTTPRWVIASLLAVTTFALALVALTAGDLHSTGKHSDSIAAAANGVVDDAAADLVSSSPALPPFASGDATIDPPYVFNPVPAGAIGSPDGAPAFVAHQPAAGGDTPGDLAALLAAATASGQPAGGSDGAASADASGSAGSNGSSSSTTGGGSTAVSQPAASAVRLRIPALDVDAPILALGMNGYGGFEVPTTAYDVGWYEFSATPGAAGNAVFGGHLNWRGSLGVFDRLDELAPGDMVYVDTPAGTVSYRVTGSHFVAADTPFAQILGQRSGPATLTLFTCGGTFVRSAGEYDQRLVVNAVLA
jgi:LPXTG-site transpeptidase (sortase) family protein